MMTSGGPTDTGNVALCIFFLQGVGSLFSWNALISATAYFGSRTCGTAFDSKFESWLGIAWNVGEFPSLFAAVLVSAAGVSRLATGRVSSGGGGGDGAKGLDAAAGRTMLGCTIPLFVFVGMAFLVLAGGGALSGTLFFWITILGTLVAGVACAVQSGGIFGIAGVFPPAFMQALMSGQALAGILASATNLIAVLAGGLPDCDDDGDDGDDDTDDDCEKYEPNWATFIYFLFTAFVFAFCIMSVVVLRRLPITQFYAKIASADCAPLSESGGERTSETLHAPLIAADNTDAETHAARGGHSGGGGGGRGGRRSNTALALATFWRVMLSIRGPATAVWLVFAGTLCTFPATTAITLTGDGCSGGWNGAFVPTLFVLFNTGDFVGRLAASRWRLVPDHLLTHAAAARLVLLPFMWLCRLDGSRLPILLGNVVWPLALMALFAVSNGYVATLAMMAGPSCVQPAEMEVAGAAMVLCLCLGLLTGSILSFAVLEIVTGSS